MWRTSYRPARARLEDVRLLRGMAEAGNTGSGLANTARAPSILRLAVGGGSQ